MIPVVIFSSLLDETVNRVLMYPSFTPKKGFTCIVFQTYKSTDMYWPTVLYLNNNIKVEMDALAFVLDPNFLGIEHTLGP